MTRSARWPPEAVLLAAATSPRRDPETIREALERCAEWEPLLRSAAANGVVHQLAVVLKTEQDLSRVPDPFRERLTTLARRALLLDRIKVAALGELLERFGKAGIPLMLLKGMALAERFYAKPFERFSIDIDVLVPASFRSGAGKLLESMGYAPSQTDFYEQHHFHVPYARTDGSSSPTIELHWQVTKKHAQVDFDVEGWWGRPVALSLRSGEALLPPPGEELAYLCHHAFTGGSATLRGIRDIARYLDRAVGEREWDDAKDAARRAGATLFLRQAMELSERLWGIDAGESPAVPQGSRRRQWLVRNLLDPRTVLSVGESIWWPFKRIFYWSMLDPRASPVRDLVSRSLSSPRLADERPGSERRVARSGRMFLALGFAMALCLMPLRFFPPQFRKS